ncbi:PLC-like phosphodiesterase [Syncephalis plumigaleata]|nr:PLC-like phosphodiesterase [Syncephalis plumigaleata]
MLAGVAIMMLATASSTTAIDCNGSPDYCKLPFDRYTFAGTHNSAAYNLTPDCSNIPQCKQAESVCAKTEEQCVAGWTTKCTAFEDKCTRFLPWPLNKICLFSSSVCKTTSKVCKGVGKVCTLPISLCSSKLPLMCKEMPPWMRQCFWENQPDHTIGQQLRDGIRLFDIDTCVDHNGQVVTCHGDGPSRALGAPLDEHLVEVRDFLNANPNEVVVLEYADYDGDKGVIARGIRSKLQQYLPGMLHERNRSDEQWPTLGEMIESGKRVVVIFGSFLSVLEGNDRSAWMLARSTYLEHSWPYTRHAADEKQLRHSFIKRARESSANEKKWQCVDYGYDIVLSTIKDDLANLREPTICLARLEEKARPHLDEVVAAYKSKFTHLHRVKVDYYHNILPLLLKVVHDANRTNLQRLNKTPS